MANFELVATGGTFDIIHQGHKTLLAKSFEISKDVIIGLTSDELSEQRGKNILNCYQKRYDILTEMIHEHFGGHSFQISKLEDDFGPAVLEEGVQALVVSSETQKQGDVLNEMRARRGLPPVDIVVVPMVLAQDGRRISTTRIRNSEVDVNGSLLPIDK